jgi:hypothetical protein
MRILFTTLAFFDPRMRLGLTLSGTSLPLGPFLLLLPAACRLLSRQLSCSAVGVERGLFGEYRTTCTAPVHTRLYISEDDEYADAEDDGFVEIEYHQR